MNEITIRHKLKQGHKMFSDKEVKALFEIITQLRDELKAAKAAAQQVPMFAETDAGKLAETEAG